MHAAMHARIFALCASSLCFLLALGCLHSFFDVLLLHGVSALLHQRALLFREVSAYDCYKLDNADVPFTTIHIGMSPQMTHRHGTTKSPV